VALSVAALLGNISSGRKSDRSERKDGYPKENFRSVPPANVIPLLTR
jgi:hypothetical protein